VYNKDDDDDSSSRFPFRANRLGLGFDMQMTTVGSCGLLNPLAILALPFNVCIRPTTGSMSFLMPTWHCQYTEYNSQSHVLIRIMLTNRLIKHSLNNQHDNNVQASHIQFAVLHTVYT